MRQFSHDFKVCFSRRQLHFRWLNSTRLTSSLVPSCADLVLHICRKYNQHDGIHDSGRSVQSMSSIVQVTRMQGYFSVNKELIK